MAIVQFVGRWPAIGLLSGGTGALDHFPVSSLAWPIDVTPGGPLGRRAPARQRPVERSVSRIDPMAQLVGMRPLRPACRKLGMAWSAQPGSRALASGASSGRGAVVGARHEPVRRPPRASWSPESRRNAARRSARAATSCSTIDARPSTMGQSVARRPRWPPRTRRRPRAQVAASWMACTGEQPLDVGRHRRPKRRCPRSCGRWSTPARSAPRLRRAAETTSGGSRPGQTLGPQGGRPHLGGRAAAMQGQVGDQVEASRPGERSRGPVHSIGPSRRTCTRDARKRGTRSAPPHVRNGRAERWFADHAACGELSRPCVRGGRSGRCAAVSEGCHRAACSSTRGRRGGHRRSEQLVGLAAMEERRTQTHVEWCVAR